MRPDDPKTVPTGPDPERPRRDSLTNRPVLDNALERELPDAGANPPPWLQDLAAVAAEDKFPVGLRSLIAANLKLGPETVTPAAEQTARKLVPTWTPPDFKLLKLLAEGGMGSIWEAEQTAPVSRKVAIKFVRSGAEKYSARFEIECQVLAKLSHPDIARLLDAGRTPDGLPYLVMEYVDGVPLDEFCKRHSLDLIQRLKLMQAVCLALHHAHEQGIVHRDIKPANILVVPPESAAELFSDVSPPRVKIIDFGLALRLEAGAGRAERSETREHTVIGTVDWMSPEQASGKSEKFRKLDRRTDLYSLGATLYQLLTGMTPLESRLGKSASDEEALAAATSGISRLLVSQQLKSLEQRSELPGCAPRQTRVASKLFQGLDLVLARALAASPEDRYQTALELATDLDRLGRGETPRRLRWRNTLSRLGKHPFRVAALAIAALALWVGWLRLGVPSAALLQEPNAVSILASRVGDREFENLRALNKTSPDPPSADEHLQALDKLFMESLERMSPYSEDFRPRSHDPRYLEQLQSRLRELNLLPRSKLALAYKLGSIWLANDNPTKAREVVEQTFSAGNYPTDGLEPFIAACLLGTCEIELRQTGRGLKRIETAIKQYEQDPQASVMKLLENKASLSAYYLQLGHTEKALTLAKAGLAEIASRQLKPSKSELDFRSVLAMAYDRQGMHEAAIETASKTLALTVDNVPQDLIRIVCGNNLLDIYRNAGQPEPAKKLADEIVELAVRRFGEEHTRTLDLKKASATLSYLVGQKSVAFARLKSLRKLAAELHGTGHPLTLNIANDLASISLAEGKIEEALNLLEETRVRRREHYGITHPEYLKSVYMLAAACFETGKVSRAIHELTAAIDACQGTEEFPAIQVLELFKLRFQIRLNQRFPQIALQELDQFISAMITRADNESAAILAEAQSYRARMLFNFGQLAASRSELSELRKSLAPDLIDQRTKVELYYAELLIASREYETAHAILVGLKTHCEAGHSRAIQPHSLMLLADACLELGRDAEAEELLKLAFAGAKLQPFLSGYGRSLRGECLRRSGQTAEATKELLQARQQMNMAFNTIPYLNAWYLPKTERRLEALYRAIGEEKSASDWGAAAEKSAQLLESRKVELPALVQIAQ